MILNPTAKLLNHGARVQEWLVSEQSTPVLVEIAPTGYCNAACPWCFFKGKNTGEKIDTDKLLSAICGMGWNGIKAINWSGGGEPTLHPDFGKFVATAHGQGIKQGLFTNAYKYIPAQDLFEWIRISLTDKGFDAIKKPKVVFGVCLNQTGDYTAEDLTRICRDAKSFGAKYFQVRPALMDPQPELEIPYVLKDMETSGFNVYLTEYKYKDLQACHSYKECYGYHFCPSIDWRGNVSACLYLSGHKKYTFGNIYNDTFGKILEDFPPYVNVTKGCQRKCKNDEINKILHAAKNVKQVEFL